MIALHGYVKQAYTVAYNARLSSCGFSMKWYDAIVSWLAWVWIFLGGSTFYANVIYTANVYYGGEVSKYLSDPTLFYYNFFTALVVVVNIVLIVIIRNKMFYFSSSLKKYLLAYLWLNIASATYVIICSTIVGSTEWITSVPSTLLFLAMHFVYFYKRRRLLGEMDLCVSNCDDTHEPESVDASVGTDSYKFSVPNQGMTLSPSTELEFFISTLACPKCGTHNDEDYKHCKECGAKRKKENNPSVLKFFKKNALTISILLACTCLFGNIIQYSSYQAELGKKANEYNVLFSENLSNKEKLSAVSAENKSLLSKYTSISYKYESLENSTADLRWKADFLDESVAFTTETGNKYHKYNCRHIANGSYYQLMGSAIANGYTPCKDCH